MLSAASLLSSTTNKRRLCGPPAPSLASAIRLSFFSINVDLPQSARVAGAAKHAFGTEFRDDPSAAVDRDDPTAPAELTEPALQQFAYRLLQPESAKFHRCTNVVRRDRADEVLPMPGRRDCADSILCIGSGPDDRRVAHASLALVRHSAGGGGSGEIARRIEGDRPDGALRGGDEVGNRLTAALAFELSTALLGAEVDVRYERQPFLQGEFLGSRPDEQYVPGLLHDPPRELDRIFHVLHRRHGARTLLPPLHDRSIELRGPFASERRAASGVEQRVVFQRPHGSGDGIEARAAFLEDGVPEIESRCEAIAVLALALGGEILSRYRAGAAVDGNRIHRASSDQPVELQWSASQETL